MAKLLKLRRGTTTQHGSFTGAEGEVTIDTTKDTAVVHDGSQAGGRPLAREDMSNVSSASIAGRLGADAIATTKIAGGALPTDVTITNANIVANASIAGTKLENSGVTAGSYGSSSAIPIVTVDAQGLVTAASTTAIDSTRIDNGTSNVRVANNGATNVSHSGTDRLSITNSGVEVTGNIDLTGNIELNDNKFVYVGDSQDGRLYHDQSNTYLEDNGTGELRLASNNGAGVRITKGTSETLANFTNDGACEFFHDNSQKMNTNASGINVSGNIAVSGTVDGVDVATRDALFGNLTSSSGVLKSSVTTATQPQSNDSTKIATTAYVRTAITEAKPFPTGTQMLFAQTSAPTGWTKVTTHNNKALRVVSGTAGTGGSNAFSNTFASKGITANAGNATQGGNVSVSVGNATAGGNVSVSVANATQGGNISVGNTTAGGNVSISNTSTGGTVNSHTLSTNQMPSHNHSTPTTLRGTNRTNGNGTGEFTSYSPGYGTGRSNATGSSPTNSTGGNGGHSHGFSGSSHNHNGTLSGTAHNHNASFSGSAHNHNANASFSGSAHNHNANASFTGSAHNHSISVGNLDMSVQYVDVIIASKN